MKFLGVINKIMKQGKTGRENNQKKDIRREEIARAIGSMIKRKAKLIDKVPNEVWKYGRQKLEQWALIMCNMVCEGKG